MYSYRCKYGNHCILCISNLGNSGDMVRGSDAPQRSRVSTPQAETLQQLAPQLRWSSGSHSIDFCGKNGRDVCSYLSKKDELWPMAYGTEINMLVCFLLYIVHDDLCGTMKRGLDDSSTEQNGSRVFLTKFHVFHVFTRFCESGSLIYVHSERMIEVPQTCCSMLLTAEYLQARHHASPRMARASRAVFSR